MNKLVELRKQQGLTRAQLSERSGVSLRSIEGYEQGRKDMSKMALSTAVALAKALELPLSGFIVYIVE